MAINLYRSTDSTDIVIRITEDLLVFGTMNAYVEEMSKAIREFVQTDSEVRILINEMVRTAFGQVDLLKLVTETIKQSLPATADKPVAEVTNAD